jgi:hypothetical protein
MRFEWRISEKSAERSGRRPLTLMNPVACARRARRLQRQSRRDERNEGGGRTPAQ